MLPSRFYVIAASRRFVLALKVCVLKLLADIGGSELCDVGEQSVSIPAAILHCDKQD